MIPTLTAIILTLNQPPPPQEKVAMVMDVQGAVTVQAVDGTRRPVKLLNMLAAGDRLTVPADGTIALLFRADNYRERVKPNNQVELTARGCLPATAVAREEPPVKLPTDVRLPVDDLSGRGQGGGVVFRDPRLPKTSPPVTPLFGATVLTERPKFAWQPVSAASGYQVRLFRGRVDTIGNRDRLLWTARTREPMLAYPAHEKDLHFGNLYAWEVLIDTEKSDGRTLYQSQFAVATVSEVAELVKLRPLATGKEPPDWLLAAMTYQVYGVYEEALALYERLAKRSPEEPRFQAVLAEYYHRAGRQEESTKALERAKGRTPDAPRK